ncbi:MAG: bifunctional demethylmenaquinone methyltransferase/2-methoxy-6-polyprenyl-1,4-benzoquinol methylase UbiE [Nitrospira sp.]|nr:bifunctional demethylmenaquinone methyltransferase/2-methoxy-6-polyprenyl-1,4-benzoquinol methylase UbiE [Nitrospira sp.]
MPSSMQHAVGTPAGKAVSQWSGTPREQAVQRMFTAIATRYDLNNSLLSFGLHHRWKAIAARDIPTRTQGRGLDLGTGTGDLALLLHRRMGEHGQTAAIDLNVAMLKVGAKKIARRGLTGRIACLRVNAECLVFPDATFDAVTAGFCIRNVGDRPRAFQEIHRVLKPGGRFVCLEFSRPVSTWLRRLYDWYSFHVLPAIGTWVASDHTDVYHYLPESIRTFPDQEQLADHLRTAGFTRVHYHNLSGGIVAIHVADK